MDSEIHLDLTNTNLSNIACFAYFKTIKREEQNNFYAKHLNISFFFKYKIFNFRILTLN